MMQMHTNALQIECFKSHDLDHYLPPLKDIYKKEGIVKLSTLELRPLLPPPETIARIADDVVLNPAERSDKVYENIKVNVKSVETGSRVETRKVLTRLEKFVDTHREWTSLASTGGILSALVGKICGEGNADACDFVPSDEPWCLFKEKLNIKPAGTSGFAAHYDAPSLRATQLCQEDMVTVMIAIDRMTIDNGCLQVIRGPATEENCLPYHQPSLDLDPDTNGRPGAILPDAVVNLTWENIECEPGDVYVFSGWLPHKSPPNMTQQQRRAVFLTYNPPSEGNLREEYYMMMKKWRSEFDGHVVRDM